MMTIVAETAKKERYSPDFMATSEDVEGVWSTVSLYDP